MNKTMKLLLGLLLTAGLVLAMAACAPAAATETKDANISAPAGSAVQSEETPAQSSAAADAKKVVGFIPTSIANNPLYTFLVDACQKMADSQGITLTPVDVKMDASLQINALENMIAQKVDVIIVDPVDAKAINTQIKAAMDQGVKIISLSGKTDAYDSYLTIDHRKVGYVEGQMAAKWINEKLGGKAEVGIFNYRLGSVLISREDGMREALEKECPGAQIVAEGQADNPTDGMKVAENFLQAHPNLKVILCVNDAGALGAVEAVQAANKAADDFAVFGADSAPEALAKIKEDSVLRGTVYIFPEELPGIIMSAAGKLANGEPVEKEIVGRIEGVTKETYGQIIKN